MKLRWKYPDAWVVMRELYGGQVLVIDVCRTRRQARDLKARLLNEHMYKPRSPSHLLTLRYHIMRYAPSGRAVKP